MATIASLGSIFNTTAGNKTLVATPAAGDFLVACWGASGAPTTTTMSDNNADGAGAVSDWQPLSSTFRTVDTFWNSGANQQVRFYVRRHRVGSATSTTFTFGQAGSTGGGGEVFAISGAACTDLLLACRGGGGTTGGTAGTTPAATMRDEFKPTGSVGNAINVLPTSICIGAVINASAPAGMTPPSGWTESIDTSYATPTTGLETAFVNTGETGSVITWGSTSATAFGVTILEIDVTLEDGRIGPLEPVPYLQNVNHLSPI